MSYPRAATPSREGPLWGLSLVVSLVLNALVFLTLTARTSPAQALMEPVPPIERVATVVMMIPESADKEPAQAAPPQEAKAKPEEAKARATEGKGVEVIDVVLQPDRPSFARTLPGQESAAPPDSPPTGPALIGERNTRATSDLPPDPTAPPLPALAGKESDPIATTPAPELGTRPVVEPPQPAEPVIPPATGTPAVAPAPDVTPQPSPDKKLLQGPQSVEVPVTKTPAAEPPKPAPAPEPSAPKPAEPTAEQKTKASGSISRKGQGTRDVVDTPLGRYQASINRAIEAEWMKNCERYQQVITAGYLSVRFVVMPDGSVKTLEVTDPGECGNTQIGFTNNAIRSAKLPKMPPEVRKKLGNQPLEQILIFYF